MRRLWQGVRGSLQADRGQTCLLQGLLPEAPRPTALLDGQVLDCSCWLAVALLKIQVNGMAGLTTEQEIKIKENIKGFREYGKTVEFRKGTTERTQRKVMFGAITPEKLKSLTEYEFGKFISTLWASRMWGNKEYIVQRIIMENDGLEKVREELHKLLFGKGHISNRFNSFNVVWMGPAMITEILCSCKPNEYGIWNDKARRALRFFGLDGIVPTKKYRISGDEYAKFNSLLKWINEELKQVGFEDSDLLLVDYFLYEVSQIPVADRVELALPEPQEFDHEEAKDKIAEIGSWLGFEAGTEEKVALGAKVGVE